MTLKDRYAIVGVGQTALGRLPGVSDLSLQAEAVKYALEDAGVSKVEVDGLITHSHRWGTVRAHHQLLAQVLGLNTRFGQSLSSGGATSCVMVQLAVMALEAEMCQVAVVVHGDRGLSRRRGGEAPEQVEEFGPEFGMFGPIAWHALGARRHMFEYGTTHDQLGAIAVAFRRHASLNPQAQMRRPITLEDYHRSRWVVEPFHLLDCCLVSDGAAALVVTSAERARHLRRPPVYIMGMGQANHSRGWLQDNHMTELAAKESGAAAFRMAGVSPHDIDTAQLYDCFTYMVLVTLEDYGFCHKGEGGAFVAEGRLELGGELPTNTSGGMLSEGYVEGMLQIVEAVRQLRGECGARQVRDAELAMVSGNGGHAVCHSTLILRR